VAARSAAASWLLATPADEPETAASQSGAEAWPSLAYEPVSVTFGLYSAVPDPASLDSSAKYPTMDRASSPLTSSGRDRAKKRRTIRVASISSHG
jgi:hypothetical protein